MEEETTPATGTTATDPTSPPASSPTGADPIASTIAAAGPTVEKAVLLNETKAEVYIMEHLFGKQSGDAYLAVLTGNATVQSAIAAANGKAVSFLEKMALTILYPELEAAMKKVGLV